MTTLLGLNAYQSEALIACLAASVLWAGFLFLGAMHLERRGAARGDKLWVAALLLAVLPSLAAPSLAAFGVSLRAPSAEPAIVGPAESVPALDIAVEDASAASSPEMTPDSAALAGGAPLMSFDQAMDALALLYLYGAALALFIWVARQAGFMLAAGLADPVRNEKLLAAVADWAFDFGVKAPALKRSRHVSSVCVYGAVSPVILLPYDLDARVAENDIVLMCAHEIAHLKRGDTRLFTATALTRVLFWFNPLVTRIAAQVELAAEEGADRLVISAGIDRRAYASCFVKALKYAAMKQSLLPALSPGFTPADRHGRRRRLDSILSADGERRTSTSTRVALAGAASIAALLAVGQAAFAVDPEAAAEKKRLAALASIDPLTGDDLDEAEPPLKKPVDGDVTLPFGKIYTSLADNKTPVEHQGVDIRAAKGSPVRASARGVVVEATTRLAGNPGYGATVIIDHGHGLISRYAHLDSFAVKTGDSVEKGEIIGAVGETGLVTGPHLHFEVLKNGAPVDPALAYAPTAPEPPEPPIWAEAEIAPLPPEPVEPPEPSEPDAPAEPAVLADARFPGPGFDFAFANGDTLTDRMAADLEQRLLGDLNVADGAAYDITFNLNGETYRFTSDDPMTPEKRAKIKAVVDEMRVHREAARREMAKAHKEWRKQAEEIRHHFAKTAAKQEHFAFVWKEDEEGIRRDLEEARQSAFEAEREARQAVAEAERAAHEALREAEREALSAELEALSDAHADLADSLNDGLEDALVSLDEEEDALADDDLTEEERRLTHQSLANARREIERARRDHEREIERTRRELERRKAEIQRELTRLDETMSEEN